MQDLERRTSEATSRAEHPAAKRAVALLARRDLLDFSLEGAADVLDEASAAAISKSSTSASLFLRSLRSRASSLLDAWRSLLEDCETEAEAELSAAQERARAAEARAEAAEARLLELTAAAATAPFPPSDGNNKVAFFSSSLSAPPYPPPKGPSSALLAASSRAIDEGAAKATAAPPPASSSAPSLLPDAIAAVTLVPASFSSPTKLKKLEVRRESAAAAKRIASISSPSCSGKVARAPPASRLPPTEAEARALLEAERAAEGGVAEAFRMPPASAGAETPLAAVVAAREATADRRPHLQRSSSSSASLLLLGLPDAPCGGGGGGGSRATPGSPSLSLRAVGKFENFVFLFFLLFFEVGTKASKKKWGRKKNLSLTFFLFSLQSPFLFFLLLPETITMPTASVLDDIFACKGRADERARQAGATRPSLSAFLDSYLLARFGGAAFGAIAREWRQAIEGASAAAHRALFSLEDEEEKGEATKALSSSLSSSSSAALVEAAAFWAMLRNQIDEEWWFEASRLRKALASDLGGLGPAGGAGAGGDSGAATPAAAASAPASPASATARRVAGAFAAAAAVTAAFYASSSSSSSLPHAVEKSAWLRALEAALPSRALAREAARRVEEALNPSSSGDGALSSSSAAPRSLVLSCALRASLAQRISRLAPAADAFAAAAAAEAEEAGGSGRSGSSNNKTSSSSSSLRPRAFKSFCRVLSPGMRARDVAALLDALVPTTTGEDGEGDGSGAAVAWSTAAAALAAELEREEEEVEEERTAAV